MRRSGTKGFWGPEQLHGKENTYTNTVDIWTLGVCAYHWATGKTPFAGEDHDEVAAMIKKGEYNTKDFPQAHISTLPPRRTGCYYYYYCCCTCLRLLNACCRDRQNISPSLHCFLLPR